jgi:hypothetical protein
MSARLGFNEIPYIPWKGKTFVQITTSLQKNRGTIATTSSNIKNIFKPTPSKIVRREIVTTTPTNCYSRASISIDELNQPNGYLVYPTTSNYLDKGLDGTLDINLTTNKYELNSASCNTSSNCINRVNSALRRVRSAGGIPKKFNAQKNNDQYYSSSNQYLYSRNKTFDQNQYHFIRQGNPTVTPGSAFATQNVYSTQGLSHCNLYYISAALGNNTFSYKWIDGNTYSGTIPDGYYDFSGFAGAFQSIMSTNNHYYIRMSNNTKLFLMNFTYDTLSNSIQFQSYISNPYYGNVLYSAPPGVTWNSSLNISKTPQLIISGGISSVIGFSSASYPSSVLSANYAVTSTAQPKIAPEYVIANYKPNNYQFATQGAVDSSSLITRIKYDTLRTTGATMKNNTGSSIANSLAYAVPESTNGNIKKAGNPYPLKNTPVIDPITGAIQPCKVYRTRR